MSVKQKLSRLRRRSIQNLRDATANIVKKKPSAEAIAIGGGGAAAHENAEDVEVRLAVEAYEANVATLQLLQKRCDTFVRAEGKAAAALYDFAADLKDYGAAARSDSVDTAEAENFAAVAQLLYKAAERKVAACGAVKEVLTSRFNGVIDSKVSGAADSEASAIRNQAKVRKGHRLDADSYARRVPQLRKAAIKSEKPAAQEKLQAYEVKQKRTAASAVVETTTLKAQLASARSNHCRSMHVPLAALLTSVETIQAAPSIAEVAEMKALFGDGQLITAIEAMVAVKVGASVAEVEAKVREGGGRMQVRRKSMLERMVAPIQKKKKPLPEEGARGGGSGPLPTPAVLAPAPATAAPAAAAPPPVPSAAADSAPAAAPTDEAPPALEECVLGGCTVPTDFVNLPIAKALYDTPAEEEDELGLTRDCLLIIVEEDETGWATGWHKGAVGLFPRNYVEIMEGVKLVPGVDLA